jgi:8-oxo-dGTP diphosphatase
VVLNQPNRLRSFPALIDSSRWYDSTIQMDYERLLLSALNEGRQCLAGALILNHQGRVFLQRRAPHRRLLPGCWDIVGGHVEAGESILEALSREITEETGWQLVGRPQLCRVTDWELEECRYREFDFVVDVSGDKNNPRLEASKHVEFRWLGPEDVAVLDENPRADEGMIRELVELAFRSATPKQLTFPHATIFIPLDEVEQERSQWDPAMAEQISAHVTVVYPVEVGSLNELIERLTDKVRSVSPFRLVLDKPNVFNTPSNGVFLTVEDIEGGWLALRQSVLGANAMQIQPHLTLVHPRTSNRGEAAWNVLQGRSFYAEVHVKSVAINAFNGRNWPTVANFPLGK